MQPRLKLYTGDDQPAFDEPKVPITVGEICEILTDAGRLGRTWLQDFEDETVEVSEDLFEVLTAYWQLRPGA